MIYLTVPPLKNQQQRTKLAGQNLTFENPVHHYLLIVHKMKSKERGKNTNATEVKHKQVIEVCVASLWYR